MAVVSSGAAVWPMEIAARDSSVVAGFYQLVGHLHVNLLVWHLHLLLLVQRLKLVCLLEEILSFEFVQLLVGKLNELAVRQGTVVPQYLHDCLPLV